VGTRSLGGVPDTSIENEPSFRAWRMRALNAARQKALVTDTVKLLELARALDAEVRASGSEELTGSQRGTVAQIEKLAHHVRERMAESDADLVAPRQQNSLFDR
jgi:hypothetical protein